MDSNLKGIFCFDDKIEHLGSNIILEPEKYGHWMRGCDTDILFGNHPVSTKLECH
jgi:hypothetical protein